MAAILPSTTQSTTQLPNRKKKRAAISRVRWLPYAWLQPIRNYLRTDMVVLRWVLVALYVAPVGLLLASRMFDRLYLLILIGVTLGCQAFFIFGAGTVNFCKPVRKRRLWMPALVAASLCTVLAGGLMLAMGELLYLHNYSNVFVVFWTFVVLNWICWFFIIFFATRNWTRMQVLCRLTGGLIAGSLAELLAVVPAHMIVSRRPGCFVGMATMCGILAGLYSMMFAFGPGIALLFLRPKYRVEKACLESDQTPTPPHYQFQLRSVFVIMFFCAIIFGWVGVQLNQAWKNQQTASDIYEVQAKLRDAGAEVELYFRSDQDSLDRLLGNPGEFYIGSITGDAQFGDDDLAILEQTPDLQVLELQGKLVTDRGMQVLGGLKLNSLKLAETEVSDAGLESLKDMPIDKLDLSNTHITDAGLRQLKSMKSLQVLNLDGTDITDDGIEQLAGLQLYSLWVSNTMVTDAAIPYFKQMKSLEYLEIKNTRISETGVQELEMASDWTVWKD